MPSLRGPRATRRRTHPRANAASAPGPGTPEALLASSQGHLFSGNLQEQVFLLPLTRTSLSSTLTSPLPPLWGAQPCWRVVMWKSASGVCAVKDREPYRYPRGQSGCIWSPASAGFWDTLTDLGRSLEVQSRRSDGETERPMMPHTQWGTHQVWGAQTQTPVWEIPPNRGAWLWMEDLVFLGSRSRGSSFPTGAPLTVCGYVVCKPYPCKSLWVAPKYIFGKV